MVLEVRWEKIADLFELSNNLLIGLVLLEKSVDQFGNIQTQTAFERTVLGADVLLDTSVDFDAIESSEDHILLMAALNAGPVDLFSLADLDMSTNKLWIGVLGDKVQKLGSVFVD